MGYFDDDEEKAKQDGLETFAGMANDAIGEAKSVLTGVPSKKITMMHGKSNTGRYEATDIIQLKNISQVYQDKKKGWFSKEVKEHVVFDNFNMSIKDVKDAGQFVVIVGASGCGKSTILRYIAGLQKPTSGEISFYGEPQTNLDRFGMVFQQYSSLPWRTVLKNVAFSLELQGVHKYEREERAMEMIKLVGLEGHEHKYAQHGILSGGQLQRVALARNLVSGDEIMLLDEACSGLDQPTKLEMGDLLCKIWTKIAVDRDPTFLMVTHDLSEAVYLADEIYVMDVNPGRVIEELHIDLPLERDKSIKRTKKFLDYYHYLEDKMAQINSKNK